MAISKEVRMSNINRTRVYRFLNAAPYLLNLNNTIVILIAKRLQISAIELKALLNTSTIAK
jgi:hypothetical protein